VADGFLQFFFNSLDRCHGFSSQPPPALAQAMLQLPQYGSSCINQQLIRLAFVQTFACGAFKFRPEKESEKSLEARRLHFKKSPLLDPRVR
jgi:hypothetical protein